MLMWLLWPPLFCTSQIGIGTTSPNNNSILDLNSNTKGLLIPRMTGVERAQLDLTNEDIGMMVYQTGVAPAPLPPTPKGVYFFDGENWSAPLQNGLVNGQTLRWDGNKWVYTTNLFNQGSSIGIGTTAPKTQLHIHSIGAPTTRLQLTNATTGAYTLDGLVLGVSLGTGLAHVLQNENKPLWFGTNGTEKMRIDSAGNVAIGRTTASAKLDVNGTVKIGTSGTVLNGIMKQTIEVEIPAIVSGGEEMVNISYPEALKEASVYVSPGEAMTGLMIGYARVSQPGNIEVKFMNMSDDMEDSMTMVLYVSIIQ